MFILDFSGTPPYIHSLFDDSSMFFFPVIYINVTAFLSARSPSGIY